MEIGDYLRSRSTGEESRGRSTTAQPQSTVHRRERRGSGSAVRRPDTGGREDGKGASRGRKDLVHTDASTWMTGGQRERRGSGSYCSVVPQRRNWRCRCDDDDGVAEKRPQRRRRGHDDDRAASEMRRPAAVGASAGLGIWG
jgi:hypothetical protein